MMNPSRNLAAICGSQVPGSSAIHGAAFLQVALQQLQSAALVQRNVPTNSCGEEPTDAGALTAVVTEVSVPLPSYQASLTPSSLDVNLSRSHQPSFAASAYCYYSTDSRPARRNDGGGFRGRSGEGERRKRGGDAAVEPKDSPAMVAVVRPGEITKQIQNCQNMQVLLALLRQHKAALNTIHICAALTRVVRLVPSGPPSAPTPPSASSQPASPTSPWEHPMQSQGHALAQARAKAQAQQELLQQAHQLLDALAKRLKPLLQQERYISSTAGTDTSSGASSSSKGAGNATAAAPAIAKGPREVGTLLWACRKLRHDLDPKLVADLLDPLMEDGGQVLRATIGTDSGHVTALMLASGASWALRDRGAPQAQGSLPPSASIKASAGSSSGPQLPVELLPASQQLPPLLAQLCEANLHSFSSVQMVDVASCLSWLRYHGRALESLAEAVQRRLGEFAPGQLVVVLQALQTAGQYNPDLMESGAVVLLEGVQGLQPHQMVRALAAYETFKHPCPLLASAVARRLQEEPGLLRLLQSWQVPVLLRSLYVHGCYDPMLYDRAADQLLQPLQPSQPQQGAKQQGKQQQQQAEALSPLASMGTKQLVQLVRTLVLVRHYHGPLLAGVCEVLQGRMDEVDASYLANTLHWLAVLGHPAPQVFQQAVPHMVGLASTGPLEGGLCSQDAAKVLWAYMVQASICGVQLRKACERVVPGLSARVLAATATDGKEGNLGNLGRTVELARLCRELTDGASGSGSEAGGMDVELAKLKSMGLAVNALKMEEDVVVVEEAGSVAAGALGMQLVLRGGEPGEPGPSRWVFLKKQAGGEGGLPTVVGLLAVGESGVCNNDTSHLLGGVQLDRWLCRRVGAVPVVVPAVQWRKLGSLPEKEEFLRQLLKDV